MILGHSIVSHHHHADSAEIHHHDDDHDDDDHTPLEKAFSSTSHFGDQITYVYSDKTDISITNELPQSVIALITDYDFSFEYNTIYQRRVFPPDRNELYQSLHLFSSSLRGPPAFIVA
ncbi:MAG: hypothetical protein U0U66_00755 [Cytophagaceae bacterium]